MTADPVCGMVVDEAVALIDHLAPGHRRGSARKVRGEVTRLETAPEWPTETTA